MDRFHLHDCTHTRDSSEYAYMRTTVLIRNAVMAGMLFSAMTLSAEWNWQTPRPQGNSLRSVQFIDASHGWAAGEYGTILHTTDGGGSWYEQEFARTDNILSISMVSDSEGWAAGDNGVILHTTDRGDDWLEQSSGVSGGLNSILFRDPLNGWAAGDNEVILHTTDGGATWSIRHQVFNPNSVLNALAFVSPSEGWVVGAGRRVYHTSDGGATWLLKPVGSGVTASYLSVAFIDSALGFIAGTGGELYRTTDGGLTWPAASSGDASNLNQILMQNSFVGWMVGDGSKVLRTINGGLSWSTVMIGDGEDYNGLARVGGMLWAVGEVGKIIQSSNGGTAWSSVDAGSRLSANWIDTPTPTVGVAVGQTGLILRTIDGGSTWAEQTSPSPSVSCYGVKFTDADHGWAVGDNGAIFRTTDGVNWATQQSGVPHSLFGVTFGTGSAGWIVGGEAAGFTGVILHSTDAGASWNVQYSGVPRILYGVSFPDAQNGWAVGEEGYILRTTNGGTTWSTESSGTAAALFWCSFPDPKNGWAVGDSGVILHTSDGGSSWHAQASGVTTTLYSMAHVNSSEEYIAADEGTILHTYDAGAHWVAEYSRTAHSLFGVATPGTGAVWACGDYGTVVRDSLHSPLGTINGMVYFDANNDGNYNAGDSGMGGWKVKIDGPVPDSALTRQDGTFIFENLPLGSYTLSEAVRESWTQTSPAGSFSFTLAANGPFFTGLFGNFAAGAAPYKVNGGWNVLSLPLLVQDPRETAVYPTATSPAFGYAGSYYLLDTINPGMAYWLKFPGPQTLWLSGTSNRHDTLGLEQGWNMIGTVSDTVSAAGVITEPPGLIASHFFGYNQGYAPTDVLVPGQGYWVKFSQTGSLVLRAGPRDAASGPGSRALPDDGSNLLNRMTVSDARGNHQTLYFATRENLKLTGEHALPPLPPGDCFDARFPDNSDAVLFSPDEVRAGRGTIRLRSYALPLRFNWSRRNENRMRYELRTESGEVLAAISSDTGLFILRNRQIPAVVLTPAVDRGNGGIPIGFSLSQNSPNPFNPATRVRFSVPSQDDRQPSVQQAARAGSAGRVQLKVYDVLGREIATLVDEEKQPGVYEAVWNASSVPSGIYLYRLTAGSRSAVKKMVLMK